MDLVVRTPHGDADVTIVRHGPNATLGDLIAAVSGQAVPRVARVDDRTIDCATPLDTAGLLIGSIVTTDPEVPAPRDPEDVELVQIAGPGAGRSRPLSAGTYRVGPGRRSRADELSIAAVEEAAFEITVTADGNVTVGADEAGDGTIPAVCLAGSPLRADTPWGDDVLTVANRAFVLDRRSPSDARQLPPPDPDGTVPFSRPPLRPGTPPRLPVIDAIRDATAIRPTLWHHRAGQPGAFVIPIGTRDGPAGGVEVVEIDLDTERAIAVTGRERTALARTMLVEAATALGPGDLDVVIATSPDRLAEWDWAKWLPHLRPDDVPMVLAAHDDIGDWADRSAGAPAATPSSATPPAAHVTLLVVDDPNLWRRRESPLRALLARPHGGLRVIALCEDAGLAPASCTMLITESPDRRWHLVSLTDRLDIDGVSAALVEPGLAADVARALAPLADTELPERVVDPEWASPRRSLPDCLGDPTPDDLVRRWADPDIDLTAVPLGIGPVELDLAAHDVVIAARDPREADRVAVTVAVGACTRLGPSEMLVFDLVGAPSSALADFPHAVDGPADNALESDRLIARIGHVLTLEDAPRFVVVVVGATADRQLRDALLAASPDLPGLRLIVAAGPDDAPHSEETTRITVERRGDRRRAVVERSRVARSGCNSTTTRPTRPSWSCARSCWAGP